MPIYEFRCCECDAIEETFQKVNDPTPEVCSSCGKHNSLEKIVSHTSFQLKGGGWYSDLYASTKKDAPTGSTSSSKAESSASPTPASAPSNPSSGT